MFFFFSLIYFLISISTTTKKKIYNIYWPAKFKTGFVGWEQIEKGDEHFVLVRTTFSVFFFFLCTYELLNQSNNFI